MKTGSTLRVARIMLEASAPLAIASGASSLVHDVLLARDPNGLPLIPGTTLAGVLRAAIPDATVAKTLFGDALGDSTAPEPGRLAIGDALCLGAEGICHDGLCAVPDDDALLALLTQMQPVQRDHVRLNRYGTVDGAGKFTRAAVPRGTRFVAQIELWDGVDIDPLWSGFLDALHGPASRLRMGGATRSGYGTVQIVETETRDFDMTVPDDRLAARRSVSLAKPLGGATTPVASENAHAASYVLNLSPEGPFRIGQGAALSKDPADLRPVRETVIDWGSGNAPPVIHDDRLFIPASAVKGALRHRTAFHHRRLSGIFAGEERACDIDAALAPLFGHVRDMREDGEQGGRAGRVFIDDVPLPRIIPRRITRTAIDRFSGGVRRKALFAEDVVDLVDPVALHVVVEDAEAINVSLLQAFEHALADLAHGWLALGASGTKGLGVFRDDRPDPRLAKRFEERVAP